MLNPGLAAFMADSQVPWGVQALSGMVSVPAWKSKPSWYLVSTEDKNDSSDAQRAMSKRAGSKVVEVKEAMRFTSRSRAQLLFSLSKQRMVPSQRRIRIASPA